MAIANEQIIGSDAQVNPESRFKSSSETAAQLSFAEIVKDEIKTGTANIRFAQLANESHSQDIVEKNLPSLNLVAEKSSEKPVSFDPRVDQKHMGYRQAMDGMVKMGEGPFHVAKRLLGPDALADDVRLLTEAMKEQYRNENPDDPDLKSVVIGHGLLTGKNIAEIMNRIGDDAARMRIVEKLIPGWTVQELPPTVPFDKRNRPGETRPERIDDAREFLKDIAQSAIDVKAHELWRRGLCAQGARLAFNQLPGWHIEGGSVDKSINKDPNGWRSGITLALDLAATGLFDVIPLKEFGYQNLKEGHIVGRYHWPQYVKDRPSWGGEDMGDIDIYTKKHKPPPDDKVTYKDSFVLIPKGLPR